MNEKVVIMLSGLIPESEQRRFEFLSEYGVEYEYIEEYRDDDKPLLERHLKLEKEGPDAFTFSDEYLQKLQSADILISFYSPVPSVAFENGKAKTVIILRSGVENINLPRATAAGVRVINAPGRLAAPVAEFTVGLMISEMKNIARGHARVMNHDWNTKFSNSKIVYNIKGRNIGIVGCGAVGRRVARAMKAMDANVLVYDPYCAAETLKAEGYEPVSLEELCERSDVISVHYRLTDETEGMIGKKHFELMKPTAYLINTARAGLIDEQALIDALKEHRIAGAGLDVFHEEPLPEDSPLLSMDNVTLTPHLAGTCTDLMDLTFDVVLVCMRKYFETGEWTNVVNARELADKK